MATIEYYNNGFPYDSSGGVNQLIAENFKGGMDIKTLGATNGTDIVCDFGETKRDLKHIINSEDECAKGGAAYNHHYLVKKDGGKIVGITKFGYDIHSNAIFIHWLCSNPHGSGKQLLDIVKATVTNNKLKYIYLIAETKSSIDFYNRNGFVEDKQGSCSIMRWKPSKGGRRKRTRIRKLYTRNNGRNKVLSKKNSY